MDDKDIKILVDCIERVFKHSLDTERLVNERYNCYNDMKFASERYNLRRVKKKLLNMLSKEDAT